MRRAPPRWWSFFYFTVCFPLLPSFAVKFWNFFIDFFVLSTEPKPPTLPMPPPPRKLGGFQTRANIAAAKNPDRPQTVDEDCLLMTQNTRCFSVHEELPAKRTILQCLKCLAVGTFSLTGSAQKRTIIKYRACSNRVTGYRIDKILDATAPSAKTLEDEDSIPSDTDNEAGQEQESLGLKMILALQTPPSTRGAVGGTARNEDLPAENARLGERFISQAAQIKIQSEEIRDLKEKIGSLTEFIELRLPEATEANEKDSSVRKPGEKDLYFSTWTPCRHSRRRHLWSQRQQP